jgi:hypothetical protein
MILEQVAHMVWEPRTTLDGTVQDTISQLPDWCPDPCYIVAAEILENSAIVPPGTDAWLIVKIGHGGRFAGSTGFPATEICQPNDPNCMGQLFRLAVLDLQPGSRRFVKEPISPPVSFSRSRGDQFIVSRSGTSPLQPDGEHVRVQVCWAVYFLREGSYTPNTVAENALLAPINPNIPPGTLFGTWANGINGVGGRGVSAASPRLGIRFVPPVGGTLADVRLNAVFIRSPAAMLGQLCADAAGTSGAAIGAPTGALTIDHEGAFTFAFPTPPSVVAGTPYWFVLSPVAGALDADIDACFDDPDYSSGRGTGVITNNLPNGDDFRALFRVV